VFKIDNVVSDNSDFNTVDVSKINDTVSNTKNFIQLDVRTANGTDSVIQISKPDERTGGQ